MRVVVVIVMLMLVALVDAVYEVHGQNPELEEELEEEEREAACVRDAAQSFLVYVEDGGEEAVPACNSLLYDLVVEKGRLNTPENEGVKEECCAQLEALEERECFCYENVDRIIGIALESRTDASDGDLMQSLPLQRTFTSLLSDACGIPLRTPPCAAPSPTPPPFDGCRSIAEIIVSGDACGPNAFDDGAVGAETEICCQALETLGTEDCLCRDDIIELLETELTPATFYSTLTAAYSACATLQLTPLRIGNQCPIDLAGDDAMLLERCLNLAAPVLDAGYDCDSLLDGRCSSPFVCDGGQEARYERTRNCCILFNDMNDERCFCKNDPSLRRALLEPNVLGLSLEDEERRRFLFERLTAEDKDFTTSFCGFAMRTRRRECINIDD